jgi:hypothetical protein
VALPACQAWRIDQGHVSLPVFVDPLSLPMPRSTRALPVLNGLLLAALGRSRRIDRGVDQDGLPLPVIKTPILQHMAPIRKRYEDGLKRRLDLESRPVLAQ